MSEPAPSAPEPPKAPMPPGKPTVRIPIPGTDHKEYFNGFQLGIGAGDVVITLQLNSKPISTLNASFTVAKTLAKALHETIEILEQGTGQTIMTVDDIQSSRKKINELASERVAERQKQLGK